MATAAILFALGVVIYLLLNLSAEVRNLQRSVNELRGGAGNTLTRTELEMLVTQPMERILWKVGFEESAFLEAQQQAAETAAEEAFRSARANKLDADTLAMLAYMKKSGRGDAKAFIEALKRRYPSQ